MGASTGSFEGAAVTVTTAYTTLLTLALVHGTGSHVINFEVDNATGGQTLSSFKVQLRDHLNGEWYDFLTDADFDSTDLVNMLFASTLGPQEVTAGAKAHAHVKVNSAESVRFQGKVASSTSTVTVRGNMRAS